MQWWYWILFGLALLAMEIMVPSGFYVLFFGLAALCVGTGVGLGLIESVWLEWVLFSVLAVITLLIFRGQLLARIRSQQRAQHDVDNLLGEIAISLEDLPPRTTGKAELRGTTWTVRNAGEEILMAGQRGRVVRVDGLTLWVAAE
jgi:membrane protein implicated in regulation of membrane protease activity